MSPVLLTVSFLYFLLISFFSLGLFRSGKRKKTFPRGISVIIAARNEEKYLPGLLEALLAQDYPSELYEIIVVDDRSTDQTFEIIKSYQKKSSGIRSFSVTRQKSDLIGKKGALELGIRNSRFELLAFTDADCLPGRHWLEEVNNHFQEEVDFVAGYSPLIIKNKFLSRLKNLERASMFAVTAGSFGWNWGFTCAARNIAYRKETFSRAGGFEGIGHLKSGDDDLLLQKMMSSIRKLNFMFTPAAAVPSYDKEAKQEQIDLESRRASKWRFYPVGIRLMSAFVFLYFLFLIVSLGFTAYGVLPWTGFLIPLGMKIIAESFLLTVFLIKIGRISLITVLPLAEIIYIPYFIFFALKGTFGRYEWRS